MDSDEDREALRAAERSAAAPWVDYPRDPVWHAVAPAPIPLILALVVAYGVTFAGVRW